MQPDTDPLTPHTDSAGVTFPPPALYFWTLVISGAISAIYPLPLPLPGIKPIMTMHFGVVLMLASVVLFSSAVGTFKRHDTPLPPWTSTRTLVHSGPYRFSRNPIYLAFTLFVLGFAGLIDSLWVAAAILPVVWIMSTQVIAKEERYLAQKFGSAYTAYTQRVRRWL
ncbi:MAG: isoprenylcysteine carboxylmethyltransferase family protein [Cyanobacteria bacterium HKST-UBA04]|nr:isoprenylcysteine carboxylmethyltransferase family protein [Cyanobacteria bacterium HKST-UBA04]MCA9842124.1 isoprenylcysteine carboxylmethyltransferase family protein [Cyanobacteria bacterium HKST-UBA03]